MVIMTMPEIVLIIVYGFSPGSASHTNMQTFEYIQSNMDSCIIEKNNIIKHNKTIRSFYIDAICVRRLKNEKIKRVVIN